VYAETKAARAEIAEMVKKRILAQTNMIDNLSFIDLFILESQEKRMDGIS
jgi:hypothetical protein